MSKQVFGVCLSRNGPCARCGVSFRSGGVTRLASGRGLANSPGVPTREHRRAGAVRLGDFPAYHADFIAERLKGRAIPRLSSCRVVKGIAICPTVGVRPLEVRIKSRGGVRVPPATRPGSGLAALLHQVAGALERGAPDEHNRARSEGRRAHHGRRGRANAGAGPADDSDRASRR